LLEALTPPDVKRYFQFLTDSVAERRHQEVEREALKSKGEAIREDMFHYLFQAKNPETGAPAYSEPELLAEANLLIIAGSDTTSVNLCGFFFNITQNPRIYAKLVREIRTTFASADEIVGGTTLNGCEYLRACIHESMRMTPAGPSELSRTVLRGGTTIDGDFIPEGTDVGTAGWSTGRNEETYGDPQIYRPERWIVDEASGNTAEEVARIRASFHPFSSGPGNCVGQHLAVLEMMTAIGRTLFRMDIRRAPGSELGAGRPELGWGRRNRRHFQVRDAYISVRQGPMVQFRKRAA
jgi:cytochrome P450